MAFEQLENKTKPNQGIIFLPFCADALHPSQQFFCHVRMMHSWVEPVLTLKAPIGTKVVCIVSSAEMFKKPL